MLSKRQVNEGHLSKLIDPDHEILNWQPITKIDKFGKKKIDRFILLTTHQILIIYEGVMDLQIKTQLELKCLEYIIRPAATLGVIGNERILSFINNRRSCLHVELLADPEEFISLLKLRWPIFNPKKTLKVFAVPQESMIQYNTSSAGEYNIQNVPLEKYRISSEEILSTDEYNLKITGMEKEQTEDDFSFDNSRTYDKVDDLSFDGIKGKQIKGSVSDELMNDMRASVLVTSNENTDSQSRPPTLEDFQMIIVLGKGTFGKVFLAEFNKQLYAIKVIRKDILIEYNQIKNTQLEKDIMFKCQHPFLVGMEYLFMSEMRLFFVMPFIRGGELYRFFKSKKRFKEQEVKFYAVQIALALGYLHKKGIVHRDLKLENILVDMKGYLKIIDFGLAKMLDSGSTKTYCGTPEYLAPEMIQQIGHGFAIDWWALGILIYEMRIGLTPFFNKNKNLLLTKIQKAKVIFPDQEKYNLDYSANFVDIVEKLLCKNPKQRLGSAKDVHEVLQHPWFSDIDIKKIEDEKFEPPLKPDVKSGEIDFKYFNLKQQTDVHTFVPPEKLIKVQEKQHQFDNFSQSYEN